jgi:asparagine synthase (glutamine-hydrolysing)
LSGIVGIYHRNGALIEPALLKSFVDSLAYRGPDSRECWIDGSVGLGHAMLRTTHESLNERQPASLDDRFRITADARLDDRAELSRELKRCGREAQPGAPDSELILHAYAVWGTACVDHLRGDFSFGIWNALNKQLFCARDHFGIKPFYYAQLGDAFIFSNTLNCIRIHPLVSEELNDAAIGDFLLFGLNYDNSTTTFRDIQRLAPAHCLMLTSSGFRIKHYWKPPTDGRIRYAEPEEYIENFQALLRDAVSDRLRTERVGILLSGGMDSSSIAAVTKEVLAHDDQKTDIRGYTHVYESLIPHNDEEYASETGKFLSIPIRRIPMDQAQIFEGWNDPELSWPEPVSNPLVNSIFESYRIVSADCRVVLSGEGGDDLMNFQMWPYVKDLRRRGEWRRLLTEVANYIWVRPFPWRGIRARFLRLARRDPYQPVFPNWLAPEFASRLNLGARWKEGWELPKTWMKHPINPGSYASLALPQWTLMFEQENAGVTHYPVETRYPLLDLRIVNYLLALPTFPWFFEKALLRVAMEGRLPERVRIRPKTPLQADPLSAQLRRTKAERFNQIPWCPLVDRYINRSLLVQPHGKMNPEEVSTNIRPYCLNMWLQSARRFGCKIHAEAGNG